MEQTAKDTLRQYRQGDVLLVQVPALPEATPRKATNGNHILALGEVTGHAHYLTEQQAVVFDANDRIRMIAAEWGIKDPRSITAALRVTEAGARLFHGSPTIGRSASTDGDHDVISLPIGDYIVVQPREYDDTIEFRRVAD